MSRHCVAAGEEESEEGSAESCAKVDREYNVPLRIGLIFAVLATSALGTEPRNPWHGCDGH